MSGEDPRVEKHERLIEELIKQQVRLETLASTISTTQEQHAEELKALRKEFGEEIKELKKDGIDIGKILSGMNVRFSIIQWLGVTVGAIVIAYVLGHVLAK